MTKTEEKRAARLAKLQSEVTRDIKHGAAREAHRLAGKALASKLYGQAEEHAAELQALCSELKATP